MSDITSNSDLLSVCESCRNKKVNDSISSCNEFDTRPDTLKNFNEQKVVSKNDIFFELAKGFNKMAEGFSKFSEEMSKIK